MIAKAQNAVPGSALPAPVAPGGWGVNIHFTDPQPGEMARFHEAGYPFARMDFGWARVEKEKGAYDFAPYDRLYESLKALGARPLFILDYGNDLYQKDAPTTPEARAAFARFVAASAKHFAGKPVVWEIWNEPNLDGFWKPKANASEYAALAIEAARALRTADPNATLIAPGASGFPWEYLETVFKAGLLQYLDGVSVHPYRGSMPETAASDFARLRVLVARYAPPGKKGMPLISSEWGYSTNTKAGVPEDRQASYLTRMWLANLANGVNLSIFYDWRDDGDDPTENEHRFGTVRRNLTPKPSFEAARGLIAALNGFAFRHRLASKDPNDWQLLFQRGDSDDIALVTWKTTSSLPIAAQTPTVRRLTPSDEEYDGLRRLAAFHVTRPAGALIHPETADNQPLLSVTVKNDTGKAAQATIEAAYSDPNAFGQEQRGERVPRMLAPGEETSEAFPVPISQLRTEGYQAQLSFSWNGVLLPAVAPLPVRRLAPLVVSAAPAAGGLRVTIENPGDTPFIGNIAYAEGPDAQIPLTLAKGELTKTVVLPSPGDREFSVVLHSQQDGKALVARTARMRYQPFADFPGSGAFQQVRFVENQAQPPAPLTLADTVPDGAPSKTALRFPYRFAKGWQYTQLTPVKSLAIPRRAKALAIWVYADGSDDFLRARFQDATGQTFQPDLPRLTWKGWRLITIPLDGSGPGGHWGGANNGIPSGALHWQGLLLIDSAHRENDHGGELLLAAPVYMLSG